MLCRHKGCGSRVMFKSRSATLKVMAMQVNVMKRQPRPENVQGDFYVDHTCIDCDTCRHMAPQAFSRIGDKSAVFVQPSGHKDRVAAMQALLSCPTFSIHTRSKSKQELRDAQEGLPAPVAGVPGVFANGWNSEKSYGACSYLIQRPGGNIMVDCPRFNPVLLRQLEKLGGVKYIFLTHRDDVADHAQWATHFGATRVLHSAEIQENTKDVEAKLVGEGPWRWRDIEAGRYDSSARGASDGASASFSGDVAENEDIQLIFTPGHTVAHVCLFDPQAKTLFTGDHLSAPHDEVTEGVLAIFEDVNWHSVKLQVESVAKLVQFDFLHVLPGHGRQAHFPNSAGRLRAMEEVLQQYGHKEGVECARALTAQAVEGRRG